MRSVEKTIEGLPDEVALLHIDGEPLLEEDGTPVVVSLDRVIKETIADRMITWKQSFETTFNRILRNAIRSYERN